MRNLSNFLFTSLSCLQPGPSYEQLAPHPHKYLLENLRVSEAGFRREGVGGDINYSFFDGQGQTAPDWHIFPALGTSHTQEMVKAGKRVVVAVGKYKPASLQAAIKGKLFNVPITDEMAAKELLLSEFAVSDF